MYDYYFYFNKEENAKYVDLFHTIGCSEGNKVELLRQVMNNNKFCRNGEGMDYDFFIQSLENKDIVIYITQRDNENILGACSLSINTYSDTPYITIHSICVPQNEDLKGIGSLLLKKVKDFAIILGVKKISLYANKVVEDFYKKNGFTNSGEVNGMIYTLKGGRRRRKTTKRKKSNKKRRTNKRRKSPRA
jgi:N-acetylglutamate synthase-like GNAT family acetyltransferase